MSVVVDASALVYANVSTDAEATRLRHRLRHEAVHAPHLVDAEVGNVLRRFVIHGEMTAEHAGIVLSAASGVVDQRYSHTGALGTAAWALRDNITFYDAAYVALAAALNVPLITGDRRLAHAPRLPCVVETLTPST